MKFERVSPFTALRAKLEALRIEALRVNAQVNAAVIIGDFIEMLDAAEMPVPMPEPFVTVAAAARVTGYCADHLRRLVRRGVVPNRGRFRAPRVRVSECPRKDVALPNKGVRYKLHRATGTRHHGHEAGSDL